MIKDNPDRNRLGVMRLVAALEDQAAVALNEERLPPALRDSFTQAAQDLLPAMSVVSHFLDRAENSEDAYIALWSLISSTVVLVDPEAHKTGIAGALRSDIGRRGGGPSSIKSRAAGWWRWKKSALRIAVDVWREKPRTPNSGVARSIAIRFVPVKADPDDPRAEKKLAGENYILQFLKHLRRKVNPRRPRPRK